MLHHESFAWSVAPVLIGKYAIGSIVAIPIAKASILKDTSTLIHLKHFINNK
jgi:hypothetical protein